MSDKNNTNPFLAIFIAVVVALIAGSTSPWWWSEIKLAFTSTKCNESWKWDNNFQSCIRQIAVPPKVISIPLERSINQIDGRIDFYANKERLPDENGMAQYSENKGALQVVIPVMHENTLVGVHREVIYSTNEWGICKVSSLPETTGWLKKMRVNYSLHLNLDCKEEGEHCTANLVQSGKMVQINLKGLYITIGEKCSI